MVHLQEDVLSLDRDPAKPRSGPISSIPWQPVRAFGKQLFPSLLPHASFIIHFFDFLLRHSLACVTRHILDITSLAHSYLAFIMSKFSRLAQAGQTPVQPQYPTSSPQPPYSSRPPTNMYNQPPASSPYGAPLPPRPTASPQPPYQQPQWSQPQAPYQQNTYNQQPQNLHGQNSQQQQYQQPQCGQPPYQTQQHYGGGYVRHLFTHYHASLAGR